MSVALRPVEVAIEGGEGRLVFHDERLIAVLTRLSALHGDLEGHWFLEIGFGLVVDTSHLTFASLESAQSWIGSKMSASSAFSSTVHSKLK